jgi:hypothetical protein
VGDEEGRERHGHIWPLVRDLVEKGESRGDAEAAALIPRGAGGLAGFAASSPECASARPRAAETLSRHRLVRYDVST